MECNLRISPSKFDNCLPHRNDMKQTSTHLSRLCVACMCYSFCSRYGYQTRGMLTSATEVRSTNMNEPMELDQSRSKSQLCHDPSMGSDLVRPIPHYTKSCLKSHFSGTFPASCHGDHFEKRAKVKSACCLQSNTSTLFQGNFLPFQDTFLTFLQPFDFFPNVFPVVSFSCGEL